MGGVGGSHAFALANPHAPFILLLYLM